LNKKRDIYFTNWPFCIIRSTGKINTKVLNLHYEKNKGYKTTVKIYFYGWLGAQLISENRGLLFVEQMRLTI
jgi:hypothetical protein